MYQRLFAIGLVLLSAGIAQGASPQEAAAERAINHYNLEKKGLAIQGYDPVAYRSEGGGKPAEGKKSLEVRFAGAVYRFANASNRSTFIENPERFEPAYGGWCAWAMGKDKKVEIDPESFLVEGDTLLLFYDGWFNDTREKWIDKGGKKVRSTANTNWKKLTGEVDRWKSKAAAVAGLGLGGFDAVAYTAGGAAVAGSASTTTVLGGVRYRFSAVKNRDAFLNEPLRYLPLYGGHAANSMAGGEVVPGDPKVFLVTDGKLILFKDTAGREAWKSDAGMMGAAGRAWRAFLAKGGK